MSLTQQFVCFFRKSLWIKRNVWFSFEVFFEGVFSCFHDNSFFPQVLGPDECLYAVGQVGYESVYISAFSSSAGLDKFSCETNGQFDLGEDTEA